MVKNLPAKKKKKRICLQCRGPQLDAWVGKIPWRSDRLPTPVFLVLPGASDGKESTCNAGDPGSIPGSGRSWGSNRLSTPVFLGFLGGSGSKESTCNAGDLGSIPGLGRSPGGGRGNPLQYSSLENPHRQRSLVGYSPWGCKESDTTERLSTAHIKIMETLFHGNVKSGKEVSCIST